ncbi:head GIN domain-containing protein [uncultured Chitinophaga sp.]|uniref:head GIN domain-containing protein n=1 Tax=uncultured Chitinophaga sp. TaxID=339340 RepID=UPI0025DB36D5|nr:head GIN domain-containing protein [uncultured Chitinophaga sp.]
MKSQDQNWYYWFALALSILFFSSFRQDNERVNGNGNIKKEVRDATNFNGISTSGNYKVYIKQGSTYSVQVEADENLLPYIVAEVDGNDLEIHVKKGYSINPSKPVNVYVTTKDLKELSASGKGGFFSDGRFRTDKLEVSLSGSLESDLDVETDRLEVNHSGSGNLKFKGKATKSEISLSGSSTIDAHDLNTSESEVAISGSGNVRVHADKKLEVSVSGSGNVKYSGNAVVSQSVSGRGTIRKEG